MKTALTLITGVIVIAIPILLFVLSVYGFVLAFMANVLLGVGYLFIPPLMTITGFMEFFFDYNVAEAIVLALS